MTVREAAQAFVNHLTSPESEEPCDGSWQPYWTTHGALLDALIVELAKVDAPGGLPESRPLGARHYRPIRNMYRLSMDWLRDRADEATQGDGPWSLTTQQINDLAVDAYAARVDAASWQRDADTYGRTINSFKDAVGWYRSALENLAARCDDLKGEFGRDYVRTQCEVALLKGNEATPGFTVPSKNTGLRF
jgi:hypothetical protein